MKRRNVLVPVLTWLCLLIVGLLVVPQARKAQEATPAASPGATTPGQTKVLALNDAHLQSERQAENLDQLSGN